MGWEVESEAFGVDVAGGAGAGNTFLRPLKEHPFSSSPLSARPLFPCAPTIPTPSQNPPFSSHLAAPPA
jgi:hypothetical protein